MSYKVINSKMSSKTKTLFMYAFFLMTNSEFSAAIFLKCSSALLFQISPTISKIKKVKKNTKTMDFFNPDCSKKTIKIVFFLMTKSEFSAAFFFEV